jgi:hypothetical protein
MRKTPAGAAMPPAIRGGGRAHAYKKKADKTPKNTLL